MAIWLFGLLKLEHPREWKIIRENWKFHPVSQTNLNQWNNPTYLRKQKRATIFEEWNSELRKLYWITLKVLLIQGEFFRLLSGATCYYWQFESFTPGSPRNEVWGLYYDFHPFLGSMILFWNVIRLQPLTRVGHSPRVSGWGRVTFQTTMIPIFFI